MPTPRRSFRIPDYIWHVIEERARKLRTTPSHVIRMILLDWMRRNHEDPPR